MDELIKQSLLIFLDHNRVSASLLQRKLEIGFAQTMKILNELENRGYISRNDNKTKLLITKAQYDKLFNGEI